ncbi:glycosyltransferase family 2 protein [Mangrovivirga sp. M17]|uniref:Glycosyltransferase family 2 protein n=1 Tax=Mangrovivirga halotolerans TaxID=2993936 RepID=A0ABT3RNL9_9BACT|nr:glycosyltransferase family 2 protein [Mangrovivirga halotolerans]MCX2743396.1 glycosyltransferase family 2 protein [Mangrovivirga halotolerans]
MKVSVIIPVFNASLYLTRAVESVLIQPEVDEIILVEDDSTDDSLVICQMLASKYDKIKLFRHKDGVNKGAGASRNLGLLNATNEYIAFLDADDYYLPERFFDTQKIFQTKEVKVVFEAVGADYQNSTAKIKHLERIKAANNPALNSGNTMLLESDTSKVLESLILGGKGWIHLNGLTIKKEVINSETLFNESLRVSQDSEFIIKLAIKHKFKNGQFDRIVAIRYVHDNNRIIAGDDKTKFIRKARFNKILFRTVLKNSKFVSFRVKKVVLIRYSESFIYYFYLKGFFRKIVKAIILGYAILRFPVLIKEFI